MHLSFSEAKLEQAIIGLLQEQGYQHLTGDNVPRSSHDQVIIEDDLRHYLAARYQVDGITEDEIQRLIKQLTTLPASCLTATIVSRKISISNCSIHGTYPPRCVSYSIAKTYRCNRLLKRQQAILSSR